MTQNWGLPAPVDIVWCLLPEIRDNAPRLKPRPDLVMRIKRQERGELSAWFMEHHRT